MVDPLDPESAEDGTGAKKNFIGRIEYSRVDCDCEAVCARGDGKWENDIDHLMAIKPLDGGYDKQQNVLGLDYPAKGSRRSKWFVTMAHLSDIHGNLREQLGDVEGDELFEALCDFLEGRVYEFRDITWEEDEEVPSLGIRYNEVDASNTMLVPVREVTDDNELADLGVSDDNEVDEMVDI